MKTLPLFLAATLCPALLAQGFPEAAEPNDTTATATVLPTGWQGYGEIDNSGTDEDWYAITLTAPSDLLVWTSPGFVNAIGDTRVRLLASDGTTVLVDVDDGSTGTHGFYTVFLQQALAAGTYYIAVRGYDSTTFGSYTLDFVVAPANAYSLAPVAEGAEENDPRAVGGVATPSFVNSQNSGALSAAAAGTGFAVSGADYDFYEIVVTGPGQIVIETVTGAGSPALTDTVVHLADSTLTRLAFDDDGGSGLLSRLAYEITTPGTYYAVVSCYSGSGNYLLDVAGSRASVTMHTGGCAGTAGTPALGQRDAGGGVFPEEPVLGSSFYLDGTSLPPSAPMFRLIGLVTFGTPVDLTGAGAPGCLVEVNPIGTNFAISSPTGDYFSRLDMPFDPTMVGLPIEQQLAVLDLPANALGITVSNRVSAVAGLRH